MAINRELSQFGRLVEITDGSHIGIGTTANVSIGFGTITATTITADAFVGDGSGLSGLSTFSGNYNDLTNKPTIPTNNNELINGAGYITGYTVTQSDVTQYQAALSITESQISDLGTYVTSGDLSSYATQSYVGLATAGLASEAYVGLATAGLASEAYVGLATAGLASEEYVGGTWTITGVGINTTKSVGIGTEARSAHALTVSGAGSTALLVDGNARITGILSIGTGTVTIDGDNSTITATNFIGELTANFPSGDYGDFSGGSGVDAFGQVIIDATLYDLLDTPSNTLRYEDLGVLD